MSLDRPMGQAELPGQATGKGAAWAPGRGQGMRTLRARPALTPGALAEGTGLRVGVCHPLLLPPSSRGSQSRRPEEPGVEGAGRFWALGSFPSTGPCLSRCRSLCRMSVRVPQLLDHHHHLESAMVAMETSCHLTGTAGLNLAPLWGPRH